MEEIFFLGNKFSLDNEFFLFYFIFQDFLKMIFTGLMVLFFCIGIGTVLLVLDI